MKNKNVAIVGATGAVGREFVGCLESRGIPLALSISPAVSVGLLVGAGVPPIS